MTKSPDNWIVQVRIDDQWIPITQQNLQDLDLVELDSETFHFLIEHQGYRVDEVKVDLLQRSVDLRINGKWHQAQIQTPLRHLVEQMGMNETTDRGQKEIVAPMPGLVLSVAVQPGDAVSEGDLLMVLEAMKMENAIKASHSAIIEQVHVSEQQTVDKDTVLVSFQ